MPLHEIEYKIIKARQEEIHSTKEVEGKDHLDAACKLQEQLKNELDPYGNLGFSVLVNLNEKKD